MGVNASWFLTRDGPDEGLAIPGSTSKSAGDVKSSQLSIIRKRLKRFALGHNKGKSSWGDSILLEYWTGSEGARKAHRCEAIVQSFSTRISPTSSTLSSESGYSVLFLRPAAHVIPDRHLDPRYYVPSPPLPTSSANSSAYSFLSSPALNADTGEDKHLIDFLQNMTVVPVLKELKEESQCRDMIDNLPQVSAM